MKIRIEVSETSIDGKREVFINDELSHHISEKTLQELVGYSKRIWKGRMEMGEARSIDIGDDKDEINWPNLLEKEIIELGKNMFHYLNGSGRQLQTYIKKVFITNGPLYFYFQLPYELDILPIELLYDNEFLLLKGPKKVHIIRQVTNRNSRKTIDAQKRPLRLLFMASSPTDLRDSLLAYEKEEEVIVKSTEKYNIELTIEETGSLEGLRDALIEADGYDIIHLTGHAGLDTLKSGPFFYTEDEKGGSKKTTPSELWNTVKDYLPQLLFLSGCSTARNDDSSELHSFAFQMVEKGCPVVLGWGLPVLDSAATTVASVLYEYLSTGKDICYAVREARLSEKGKIHTWPLLRVFTDGTPLEPIIASGQGLRNRRTITYKTLGDNEVKVLKYGFRGRRREIQKGLRILKGYEGKYYGLLISGPQEIGKTCLAGRLIDRLKKRELLVLYGKLEKVDVIQKIREFLDRMGLEKGLKILDSGKEEYEEMIKALFRQESEVFAKYQFLILIDGFDINLEGISNAYRIKPAIIEIIKPFLEALPWADGNTNLIITSRYPFELELNGKDLVKQQLAVINLSDL